MEMNNNRIEVIGKVACPEGTHRPRREIGINKENTGRLPLGVFQVCPRIKSCKGTRIKLIANGDVYNTRLHRFEYGSYIADATLIMGYHLKKCLQRHGLDNRGREVRLKVQGYNFWIV